MRQNIFINIYAMIDCTLVLYFAQFRLGCGFFEDFANRKFIDATSEILAIQPVQ